MTRSLHLSLVALLVSSAYMFGVLSEDLLDEDEDATFEIDCNKNLIVSVPESK